MSDWGRWPSAKLRVLTVVVLTVISPRVCKFEAAVHIDRCSTRVRDELVTSIAKNTRQGE